MWRFKRQHSPDRQTTQVGLKSWVLVPSLPSLLWTLSISFRLERCQGMSDTNRAISSNVLENPYWIRFRYLWSPLYGMQRLCIIVGLDIISLRGNKWPILGKCYELQMTFKQYARWEGTLGQTKLSGLLRKYLVGGECHFWLPDPAFWSYNLRNAPIVCWLPVPRIWRLKAQDV